MKKVFENTKIIWTHKQGQSLKSQLQSCHLDPPVGKISKCCHPTCEICPKLLDTLSIDFKNGKTFTVKQNVGCNSTFCIYLLKCNCGLQYIGETDNFRSRINLHKSQIIHSKYRKLEVSKHMFSCGNKFSCLPIFLMRDENVLSRQVKEENFIITYEPELNK